MASTEENGTTTFYDLASRGDLDQIRKIESTVSSDEFKILANTGNERKNKQNTYRQRENYRGQMDRMETAPRRG